MKILVTGGAGFVGSHFCKWIAKRGWKPVVVDNLSTGHRDAVRWGPLYQVDIRRRNEIKEVLLIEKPDCVVHFASLSIVADSIQFPERYYENNIEGSLELLKAMQECSLSKIVFSSSCAVYGHPLQETISEGHPLSPINPYGYSKLAVENYLQLLGNQKLMSSIVLRYFNAAGGDPEGEIGESHEPEMHLIPLVIRAALDKNFTLQVYGSDYNTQDGTCIRDYVHVNDLAQAHSLALTRLMGLSSGAEFFNLGSGQGYSVFEIIEAVEKELGVQVKYSVSGRRAGDPEKLVANNEKSRVILGWNSSLITLQNMIRDSLRWYRKKNAAEQ